jgi:ADP-ribose pyrophosphatase YjhB (NUDIX family)
LANQQRIRVIALGVLFLHDHALFSEGDDPVKGWNFLRPIGGGIEAGETAAETVVREFEEETGLKVEVWDSLGVFENVYEYLGEPAHDVVFEFAMRYPAGTAPRELPALQVTEGDHSHLARWLPLAEVLAGVHPLVPQGLPARLAAWINRL